VSWFKDRGLCATDGACIKTPGFSSASPILRTSDCNPGGFLASLIFFKRQFGIYFPTNKPRFNAYNDWILQAADPSASWFNALLSEPSKEIERAEGLIRDAERCKLLIPALLDLLFYLASRARR
jgi:hypothetical protein